MKNLCGNCGAEQAADDRLCKKCGGSTGAQTLDHKKARVLAGEKTYGKKLVIALGVLFLALAAAMVYHLARIKPGEGPVRMDPARGGAQSSAPMTVSARNGEVRVSLASIQGAQASFYVYASGGKAVTFFALRTADGGIRTAFDSCTSCYHAKLGYRQEGEHLICNNCGMGFKPTDVGIVTGGCNPIPIAKRIDGDQIVLKVSDLEAGLPYF